MDNQFVQNDFFEGFFHATRLFEVRRDVLLTGYVTRCIRNERVI